MSAQVTEAHRAITESVCELLDSEEMVGPSPAERAAQIIADSEAKATEQANAQVESLISSAKNAIPASEHPAEPTVENWAWQIRNLGDDRRLVYAERDQLRAEVERLREWQAGVIANERLHHAERKDALARAEKAESELADIRALADRRNKRDHSQDTTHQLVVALDQALDIAQAELAATKSTLDEEVNCAEKAEHEVVRQYARAERAEALLGQLQELHGCSQEMVVHWCARAAERSLGLGEAQAELATERARLDWLDAECSRGVNKLAHGSEERRSHVFTNGRMLKNKLGSGEVFDCDHYYGTDTRAAIDAAMKEENK